MEVVIATVLLLQSIIAIGASNFSVNCGRVKFEDIDGAQFIIGGLFPIHVDREKFYEYGWLWAESMRFTINEINNSTELLPNSKLGYRIFDSCDNTETALRNTFLMAEGKHYDYFEHFSNDTCPCNTTNKNVVALVGSAFSKIAIKLASLLGASSTPMISYAATSTLLSQPALYPSFMRTVPADNNQVLFIVDVAKYFGWQYINLLACDDNYGRVGVQELVPRLKDANICLAVNELFDLEGDLDNTVTRRALEKVKNETDATVTVLWCLRYDALKVLKMAQDMEIYHRTWIATEAYGNSQELLDIDPRVVQGSFGIIIRDNRYPGLLDYFETITPANSPKWMHEYWENYYDCTFNASNDSWRCPSSRSSRYKTSLEVDQHTHVIDGVYTIAHALHTYIQETGNQSPSPKKLLPYLKNVHFTNKLNTTIAYTPEGNPEQAHYAMVNIQLVNHTLDYTTVALWDSKHRTIETVNESNIHFANESSTIPRSSCTEICKKGYKRVKFGNKPCCWGCLQCKENEYLSNNTCLPCTKTQISNKDRTACLDAIRIWINPKETSGKVVIGLMVVSYIIILIALVIFIRYWDTPIVKASNRGLSGLQIISILCQVTLPVVLMQPDVNCVLNIFAFTFLNTITVSVTFTKADRLLRVFEESKSGILAKHSTTQGNLIQYLTVGFLTLVGMAVCLIMMTTKPIKSETQLQDGVLVLSQCGHSFETTMFVIVVYLILIALVCTVYAFKARKLPKFYKETRYTGFAMFTFLLICVMTVPIYYGQTTLVGQIVSGAILSILSAMSIFLILYLPKCHIIIFKSQENTRENFRQNLKVLFNKDLQTVQ